MVLVEIFDLVVHINGRFHGIFNLKSGSTGRVILSMGQSGRRRTLDIIPVNMFLDLARLDEQDNSQKEENASEDPESHYLGEEAGGGSPGGHAVLLESRVAEGFLLGSDLGELFFGQVQHS